MTHTSRSSLRVRAGPSESLHDHIRARLVATRAPRLRTGARVFIAGAVAPLLTVVLVLIASRLVYHQYAVGLDVDPAQEMRLMWTLLLLVAMAAVSTLTVMWRGRAGFGVGAMGLAIAAMLIAPLFGALTVMLPVHLHDAPFAGVTISPWGVRCTLLAGVVGMAVMVGFTAALRRAAPVASRLRGAAVGAAAGAWAGLAVFAFCPSGDQQHLLAGHLLPVIALTLIGAMMTPRWLRP